MVTTMTIRPPKEELFKFVESGAWIDLGNNWNVKATECRVDGSDGLLKITYCGGSKLEEGVELLATLKIADTQYKKVPTRSSDGWSIKVKSMFDKSRSHYDDAEQCFAVRVRVDFRSSRVYLKSNKMNILKDVFEVTGPTSFARFFGFHAEEEDSVTFVVQNEEFDVHKLVLKCRSEPLWQAAEGRASGTRIDLDGVEPDIFKAIIDHLYLRTDPPALDSDRQMAEALICAADRFGCPDLKLLCQYELCRFHLTTSSAADLLVLAHRTSSALLLDEAMNLCADFPMFVSKSPSWKDSVVVNPDIMNGILLHSRHCRQEVSSDIPFIWLTKDGVDELSVISLILCLRKKGMDVDGSRETLVKRLESTFA